MGLDEDMIRNRWEWMRVGIRIEKMRCVGIGSDEDEEIRKKQLKERYVMMGLVGNMTRLKYDGNKNKSKCENMYKYDIEQMMITSKMWLESM